MNETDGDGSVAPLAAEQAGTGWHLVDGSIWLSCLPEGSALPAHGWKLHVSSRTATFTALVDRLLPVLFAEGCAFKVARSRRVLEDLNDGISAPASVGKAFTIYPEQERIREFGDRMAELLLGWEGPRILSDRRIRPDAPVYYRYGPFRPMWELDERGLLVASLRGPGDERFDADATLGYRQPAWATDPFAVAVAVEHETVFEDQPAVEGTVVGGHYRILEGIAESARGSTYRAIDQRDGLPVVVKQARALVDERPGLGDVRLRLRNERRVLEALDGVSGIPRFIDHFRHGDDEFLVTSDCGARNLGEDVVRAGRHPLVNESEPSRTIGRLAGKLARIVSDLHERGVFMRDIAPKNIVVDGEGVHLIDFGIASYDGVWFPGGTPGYAPARQRRGEPPSDTDDLHALGMTLLLALDGVTPVTLCGDPELPRLRALQHIRASYGATPGGTVGAIADLLDEDTDRARRALSLLATGTAEHVEDSDAPRVAPLPAAPRWSPALAPEITGNLLTDLLSQTTALLDADDSKLAAHDASVHNGSAGPGLELLHHLDRPEVADHLRDLVSFTARAASRTRLRPGLFIGSTGVAVFLRAAADLGIAVPDSGLTGVPGSGLTGPPDSEATNLAGSGLSCIPDPGWIAAGTDLISGAAGVGVGHSGCPTPKRPATNRRARRPPPTRPPSRHPPVHSAA